MSEEEPFATDRERLDFLLGVYFRNQASIEELVGLDGLPEWTERVAASMAAGVRDAIPDPRGRARRLLGGLDMMLGIYPGSDKTLSENGGGYRLEVRRCGIYDYRERAREQGVRLTLQTPCQFCVGLHRSEAAHLGVELANQLGDRGCTYSARVPEAGDGS